MPLEWVGSPSHDYPGSQVQGRISITEVARPCMETQGDQRVLARTEHHAVARSSASSGFKWAGIGWGTPPNRKGSA
jgi:hypothetical protein